MSYWISGSIITETYTEKLIENIVITQGAYENFLPIPNVLRSYLEVVKITKSTSFTNMTYD